MKKLIYFILSFIFLTSYSQQKSDSIIKESFKGISYDFGDVEMSEMEDADMPISDILGGTDDIFTNSSAYIFGPARFSMRGMESKYNRNYIGGVNVNNLERGFGAWYMWGGLNDAVRSREVQNGFQFNNYCFSDIAGSFNIETRASAFPKGFRVSYANSNRAYTNRIMLTASTGIMNNGWAITFSGTRRWANEGYSHFLTNSIDHTEGTIYDAWGYFLSIEKKFLEKHSIAFTVLGSPTKRSAILMSTQEAYDVMDNNYYNGLWGWQNGEKRNSRVRTTHQPIGILNYQWNINPESYLKVSLSYSFGTYKSTAFNWNNAYDVSPNYYKNWPNFYTTGNIKQMMLDKYNNDPDVGQIKWDNIIAGNKYSADLTDAKGRQVSAIILEGRNEDKKEFNGNIVYNTKIKDFKINTGVEVKKYVSNHYNTLEDLLGGEYWVDVDPFVARDYGMNSIKAQNNLNNPNEPYKVVEGDRYSTDWDANIENINLWGQTRYVANRNLEFTFGFSAGQVKMWRDGNMRKGLFPNNSYQESEKKKYYDYSTKFGIYYKIDGNNQFELNIANIQKSPTFINVFVAPLKHNGVFDGAKEDKTLYGDISYHFSGPKIKGRISGFFANIKGQDDIRSMYNDEKNCFTNFVISDINKQHLGLEFGLEYAITSELRINLAAAHGQYKYTDNPNLTIYKDEDFSELRTEKTYFKNYNISNGPQTALTAGAKYWSSKYWFIGFNVNYFDNSYVRLSPIKRTTTFADIYKRKQVEFAEFIKQEKLDPAMTVDMFAGKSWKIDKYFINLSLNVSNLLNNQDFKIVGYEQYRTDDQALPKKFPNGYLYMQGINFFLNCSFRF